MILVDILRKNTNEKKNKTHVQQLINRNLKEKDQNKEEILKAKFEAPRLNTFC